ncbi:TIGR03943 family putative permease subunit [Streptomyces pseudovenezuelae]|uniref:Repeat protein (TIGR03943 family) n=1 Tax=Streptomyces pseudovenezuelae TaxID=67350 RepID=A0ABT6LF53_9ACTN|nr:TIGR03943 family protein [Streptomyces pseudovenezuelae]MDH6214937.1 putative repeat protein (TIGR03943 family) [Streptomyces pseudovenezuelae]
MRGRRYGPAVLLVLTGAAVLRVTLFSDLYLRYVQAGLRPYLIVSGVALVLLGVTTAALRREAYEDEGQGHVEHEGHGGPDEHDGHSHGAAGPRVAWLLTLPAVALLLFPPPALGSYSAGREAAQRAAQGVGSFPALPAGNPVELSVAQFGSRAIYDSGRSLKGRTVRMTGFVTHGDDGTWYVTRLLVSCCAADATTSKVEVRGDDAPPTDTWVTVTGAWHPRGKLGSDAAWPPVLDATSVRQVKQPADPYEKR